MQDWPAILAVSLGGYLLGSFPTGVVISKRRYNLDVREIGSGNIGATNVTRVFGWGAGFFTLLVDVLKGFAPMYCAKHFLGDTRVLLWLAMGLVLGHCFSLFLKGKGGKGVATSLGVVLAIDPWAGLVGGIVYGVGLVIFRISSVGSLLGLAAVNLYVFFFSPVDAATRLVIAVISIIVLFRHHANIKKLLTGQYRKKESA